MDDFLKQLTGHIQSITDVILALHGLAIVIINLTPTPKSKWDSTLVQFFLSKLYRIVEVFAGLFTPLAKR
jgi:hypothetical protein